MQVGTRNSDVVEKFPPEKGRGIGYVGIALAGFVVLDVVVQWRTWEGLSAAAVAVAIGLAIWLGLVRPSVIAYTDRMVLRNFLRDIHLPWRLVSDVFGRRALTIESGGREYSSVAITTSGLDRRTLRRRLGVSPLSQPTRGPTPDAQTEPLPGETVAEAQERVRHGTDQLTPLEYARQRIRELHREYGVTGDTGGAGSEGAGTATADTATADTAFTGTATAGVSNAVPSGHGDQQQAPTQVRQQWLVVPLALLLAAIVVAVVAGVAG